jgi:hypothetical protein
MNAGEAGDAAPPGPLAELVRHIEATSLRRLGEQPVDGAGRAIGAPPEPGDLRYFRSTWSRLRVERQLTQSQAQLPENAGPLHSDRLVLSALQTLHALSPAYLNRYMGYIDTLMWLDQRRAGLATAPAPAVSGAKDRKRRPARGKAENGVNGANPDPLAPGG